jgi:hypothetical protein
MNGKDDIGECEAEHPYVGSWEEAVMIMKNKIG